MRRHEFPVLLVSVVAAGLLVACGGSDDESARPQSNGVAQLEPDQILEKALTPAGALTKTGIKTVRGLNVVGVVQKANNETLYIATEGEPYPAQVQSDTGQGALDFLEWNQPVDVQAPPPDQVVDLAKLTGK